MGKIHLILSSGGGTGDRRRDRDRQRDGGQTEGWGTDGGTDKGADRRTDRLHFVFWPDPHFQKQEAKSCPSVTQTLLFTPKWEKRQFFNSFQRFWSAAARCSGQLRGTCTDPVDTLSPWRTLRLIYPQVEAAELRRNTRARW